MLLDRPYAASAPAAAGSLAPTPPPAAPPASTTSIAPGAPPGTVGARIGNYQFEHPPKVLGRGSFGAVLKAAHVVSGRVVAIKLPSHGTTQTSNEIELLAFAALKAKPNANVITCLEVVAGNSLVFELGHTSLSEFLLRPGVLSGPSRGMTEPEARKFFKQMLRGVHHLHHNVGMAHLDLKPDNFVLCGAVADDHTTLKRGVKVKLIDFGVSKTGDDAFRIAAPAGTRAFAAPEIYAAPAVPAAVRVAVDGTPLPGMAGVPFDGFLADVWPLGICLFVMTTGQLPFDRGIGAWLRPPPYTHCACYSYVMRVIGERRASVPPQSWSVADLILPCYPAHGPNYMSQPLKDLLTNMLMPVPQWRCRLEIVISSGWVNPPTTPARKRPAEGSPSASGDAPTAPTAPRSYPTPEPAPAFRSLSAGPEEDDDEDADIEDASDDSYSEEEEEECCYRSLPCTLDDASDCEGRPSLPIMPLQREDAMVW